MVWAVVKAITVAEAGLSSGWLAVDKVVVADRGNGFKLVLEEFEAGEDAALGVGWQALWKGSLRFRDYSDLN